MLTLILAFIPMFGPECRANKVYPACMNWTANLFIINFIFHCVIKFNKDYFFKPSASSETSEQSQSVDDNNYMDADQSSVDSKDMDWANQVHEDKLSKKMFRR